VLVSGIIITARDTPEDVVKYYLSFVFIMVFYALGPTIGVLFLIIHIVELIIHRNLLFVTLTIVSAGWVGCSVFLWILHGPAI
jgi:hypothetical protein